MTARHRSAGLALLLAGGVLAAALTTDRRLLGAPPVPVRTAQQAVPSSPEPPLADAPLAPVPAAPSPGPAPGTPNPVDPPVPAVSLKVRVPALAQAGQDLEYKICVENSSRAAAHHVRVRNPLPANA